MKNSVILLLPLFLYGCGSTKHSPVQQQVIEKEIKTEYLLKDTVISVVEDRSMVKALIQCDSTGTVMIRQIENLQGRLNARQSIRIHNDTIIIECICDSMDIYMQLREKYEVQTKKETVYVEVEKELGWWKKGLIFIGAVSFLWIIYSLVQGRKP